jgi:hypothetical protein
MVFEKQKRSQGSRSFLKKRTKKLLIDLVRACRDRRVSQRTKVFWFFFSKKNCFLA